MTLSFHNFQLRRGKRIFLELDSKEDAFSFEPGIYLIVAPNGFGKSTFLQCLAGALPDFGGQVLWKNQILRPETSTVYFPEYLAVPKYVYAHEWVNFIAQKPVEPSALNDLAKRLGVENKISTYLGRLSQGERRKQSWMGVHFSEKPLVLLDEPFDGLDLWSYLTTKELLKDWKRQNRVVILVSHQVLDLLDLADYILVFSNKKLLEFSKITGKKAEKDDFYADLKGIYTPNM